ncbi:MAG: fimbrillin family protein, partial [Bacteroidales bacterium]|nr:fimbrillin family protein [Bacteroidales bacterium]
NANAQAVQLNLKHLLSRVGFQVVANQDGDVQIDIKEITLYGNFPTQGKVNLKGSGVIDPITTEDDANAKYVTKYDFFPTANHFVTTSSVNPVDIYENTIHTTETDIATGEVITKEETNSDDSNRFMMIMPSTQATTGTTDAEGNVTFAEGVLPGAYIEVKYQLTDADEQIARVSLDGWKFEAGRSYTFRFKVSTLSIEFDVKVDSWLEHFEETDGNGNLANGDGTYTLMPIA